MAQDEPPAAHDLAWAICVHCQRKKLGQISPGQELSAIQPALGPTTALWCRTCKKNSYVVPAQAASSSGIESPRP